MATRDATAPRRRRPAPRTGSDGTGLLAAARAATARLEAHVDEVDALNVFPVPDGDTGTNMLATMRAALAEVAASPERSLAGVASGLSRGALTGARGNSGLLLSQMIRGMAEQIQGAPSLTGTLLAHALRGGADAARAAIAQPVEGTLLTVAHDAAVAAAARADGRTDLGDVLEAAVEAARASVARTPDLLPVLREAGVVDAGGHALFLLLAGALSSLRGADAAPDDAWIAARPRLAALADRVETGFGFETTFVLRSRGSALSATEVRRHLEEIAESVVVAGDESTLRIHVHAGEPHEVVAYGRSIGIVEGVDVEDLDRQAREMCDALALDVPTGSPAPGAPSPVSPPGLVAVADGAGIARILSAAGAVVVERGDSAPNAARLAAAIRTVGASEVLLLPDDATGALALDAARMVPEVDVTIVRMSDPAQAVAAALALDPAETASRNASRMLAAGNSVRTVSVPAGGSIDAAFDPVAALGVVFELLTVYVGAGAEPEETAELSRRLREAHPDVEVEIVDAGQRRDRYLIAAE